MSTAEVDAYIQQQPEPQRSLLESLRASILRVIPDAEQCISYAMPGFRVRGKVVAGFAAFKNHIGFFPHSGQVFKSLNYDLTGYTVSEKGGGIHLPLDKPIDDGLVEAVITERMRQAFDNS